MDETAHVDPPSPRSAARSLHRAINQALGGGAVYVRYAYVPEYGAVRESVGKVKWCKPHAVRVLPVMSGGGFGRPVTVAMGNVSGLVEEPVSVKFSASAG